MTINIVAKKILSFEMPNRFSLLLSDADDALMEFDPYTLLECLHFEV